MRQEIATIRGGTVFTQPANSAGLLPSTASLGTKDIYADHEHVNEKWTARPGGAWAVDAWRYVGPKLPQLQSLELIRTKITDAAMTNPG